MEAGDRGEDEERVEAAVEGRDMAVDGRDNRSIVAVFAADVGRNIGRLGDSRRLVSGHINCFSKCRSRRTTVFKLHR
jgi:hypothetical protein